MKFRAETVTQTRYNMFTGEPIADTEVWIVDEAGNKVALFVKGFQHLADQLLEEINATNEEVVA